MIRQVLKRIVVGWILLLILAAIFGKVTVAAPVIDRFESAAEVVTAE
ncbi:MAG: hypothetical protein AB1744_05480 [Candidatus Zixiibacteriota bacterium]